MAAHGATEVTAAADVTTVTSCRRQRAVSPGRLQRSVPFVVGHVLTATEILTLLRRRAGVSFPYLLDDPGCRKVRVASGTGHGFQFSALDGFA